MKKVSVLVVEDSLTIRKRLIEVLSGDPELEVVGEASDGGRGFELCQELRPDVITMDIVMPVMTGLEATEKIMAYCPTPILIVSASMNRREVFNTFDALEAGAVDVIDKPKGDEEAGDWERKLRRTVKLVARVPVISHPRGRMAHRATRQNPPPVIVPAPVLVPPAGGGLELIAIGGSTGGPAAVAKILAGLPRNYPLPVVVLLHIGSPFSAPLVDWLNSVSPIPVRAARDGEPIPKPGTAVVLMPAPDRHLTVEDGVFRLSLEEERHSCRPSVDVLFDSLAVSMGSRVAAFLLTGMGKDGAEGLLAMRRAGAKTFAQDRASSVVFGMPGEAVRIGAAERVLSLDEVAATMLELAARPQERRRG